MAIRFSSILLWLFVINLGVAFGAGLYETRVVVAGWADTSPQTWPNTGLMFWVYVTTVPLTLLTIANAVAAWRDSTPRRHAWRAAVMIAVLERFRATIDGVSAMSLMWKRYQQEPRTHTIALEPAAVASRRPR